MERKKSLIIIVIIIAISLIAFFYPKQRVFGGLGGFIQPGATSYKEEYSCFGFIYDSYATCADCSGVSFCFGQIHEKKCYNEVLDPEAGYQKTETACR